MDFAITNFKNQMVPGFLTGFLTIFALKKEF
jgi:hypothetical protein